MESSKNVGSSDSNKNKTNHLYIVQMIVNASGNFVGSLLTKRQETQVVFGPEVKKNIDNLFRPHVEIACSK